MHKALGQNRHFFVPCDLEIWRMPLKNNRAPLLCCFKLCAWGETCRNVIILLHTVNICYGYVTHWYGKTQNCFITMTSWWARWRLKSPASRLFTQPFVQAQRPASLAFVRGIHRWPVNSPHKGPVTRKILPLIWWRHHVTLDCSAFLSIAPLHYWPILF